jgi:ABC-type amino acid transport substrate-binding protein
MSERYEPVKSHGGTWFWVAALPHHLPAAVLDALEGGVPGCTNDVRLYPTREAAVAALEAARAKAGGGDAADLLAQAKKSLAFVKHTLEFFGWGQFPNLEAEVEQLRDRLAAAIARAESA